MFLFYDRAFNLYVRIFVNVSKLFSIELSSGVIRPMGFHQHEHDNYCNLSR